MKFGRARTQADGSIVYPQRGWEPPPPIEGFERDPNNKWRFIPKWATCFWRAKLMSTKPCGAVRIIMLCNCINCPMHRQQVRLSDCENCVYQIEKPGQ